MADEHIKIVIGAAKSASVDRVFRDIRRDANKIGSELGKFFNKAAKGLNNYAAGVRQIGDAVRGQLREEENASRARRRQMSEEEKQAKRLEAARRYVHNLRMRQLQRESTEQERVSRREEASFQRRMQRFSRMTSHRATRFFWPNAPMTSVARRAGMDLARGIGLDLSPSSAISGAVQDQSAAVRLSNASIIADDPRNAYRVAPSLLTQEAGDVGARYGYDPSQVLAGLNQYGKRTGDLATGREMLEELTRIAAATGSQLDQLFGTAGELANQLTDLSPDEKPKAIIRLLKSFAGQGKLGAVELEDLSRYGARIASTAGLYEGTREQNITNLGALAQASRAFGGADTPAMAATSVARLATTFKTSARAKQFESLTGNSVFGEGGKIRDPIELIKEAVVATKGKPIDWNKIFMNVMAERAAGGLASRFREAYDADIGDEKSKTAAGIQAIDGFMDKMRDAALSEEQIQKNLDATAETYEHQVNALNVKFRQIATRFLDKFLPALERVAPKLEDFAEMLGKASIWILENPKKAIAAAVGLSIARAGLESVFRIGLEKAFEGGNSLVKTLLRNLLNGGGGTPRPPVLPTGAAGGAGGAGLVAAGVTVAAPAAAAALAAGSYLKDRRNLEEFRAEREKSKGTSAQTALAALNGGDEGEMTTQLEAARARQRQLDLEAEALGTRSRSLAGGPMGMFGGGGGGRETQRLQEIAEESRRNREAMERLEKAISNGITVKTQNAEPGRGSQAGDG